VRKKYYRKAGIAKLPANAFRKCFASFDWSVDRDTKRLSVQLGNSPGIAERYYIADNLSDNEGTQFKQIVPAQKDEPNHCEKVQTKEQKKESP
jgi:hypothetical protein